MTVDEALYVVDAADERWHEWCMDCKHFYKRKNDDDTMYCRLRKRKCPHLSEMAERKEE